MTDHNKENNDKEIVIEAEEIQMIEEQTQESTDDTQTNESFTTSEETNIHKSTKWYHFNKKNLIILVVALFVGLGSGVAVGAEIVEKEEHHHKITAMSKRLHEYEHEREHDHDKEYKKEHDKKEEKEEKKYYKHQQSEQENAQQENSNLKKEENRKNKEKNQDTEKEVETVSSATPKKN